MWCLFSGRRQAWEDDGGRVPEYGAIIARVLSGERPDLATLRADTPAAAVALIQRCWAHDPATRPQAVAISREIEAWLLVRSDVCAGGRLLAYRFISYGTVRYMQPTDPRDAVILELRARIAVAEATVSIEREAKCRAERLAATADAARADAERRAIAANSAQASAERRAAAAEADKALAELRALNAEVSAFAIGWPFIFRSRHFHFFFSRPH